jgi:hypothetical protein
MLLAPRFDSASYLGFEITKTDLFLFVTVDTTRASTVLSANTW